jgi:hypothetical protein
LRPGRYATKVTPASIAPTLSKLLGLEPPAGCEVEALHEALALDSPVAPPALLGPAAVDQTEGRKGREVAPPAHETPAGEKTPSSTPSSTLPDSLRRMERR